MTDRCTIFARMKLPNNVQKAESRKSAAIRLDTNESPYNTPYNRYPDEGLEGLKRAWGVYEHIPERCIYFSCGTEEAVDLCMRSLTIPGRDDIVTARPTRTIYNRRARINRLGCREVSLRENDFSLDPEALLNAVGTTTRLIFLCSPNSPTGNLLKAEDIETVLDLFDGYVVVDESYIDFTPRATLLPLLNNHANLILLRSFSHAWSSAGLRLAAIVARPEVINDITRIGLTHPLSTPIVREAEKLIRQRLDVDKWVGQVIEEREKVVRALHELDACKAVYPSSANFILTRFEDPETVASYLLSEGVAVRSIDGFIRITIGLPNENSALIGALRRRK